MLCVLAIHVTSLVLSKFVNLSLNSPRLETSMPMTNCLQKWRLVDHEMLNANSTRGRSVCKAITQPALCLVRYFNSRLYTFSFHFCVALIVSYFCIRLCLTEKQIEERESERQKAYEEFLAQKEEVDKVVQQMHAVLPMPISSVFYFCAFLK